MARNRACWLALLVACGGTSKTAPEPITHSTNEPAPAAADDETNLDEYVDPASASPKRSLLLGPDPANTTQQLDKQAIRKIVKQHLPKIFYCYESSGDYSAMMRADFTIDANGLVPWALVTGSDSLELVRCMSRVFLNMQFPKPAGGGRIQVSYPLEIRVAGQ